MIDMFRMVKSDSYTEFPMHYGCLTPEEAKEELDKCFRCGKTSDSCEFTHLPVHYACLQTPEEMAFWAELTDDCYVADEDAICHRCMRSGWAPGLKPDDLSFLYDSEAVENDPEYRAAFDAEVADRQAQAEHHAAMRLAPVHDDCLTERGMAEDLRRPGRPDGCL